MEKKAKFKQEVWQEFQKIVDFSLAVDEAIEAARKNGLTKEAAVSVMIRCLIKALESTTPKDEIAQLFSDVFNKYFTEE